VNLKQATQYLKQAPFIVACTLASIVVTSAVVYRYGHMADLVAQMQEKADKQNSIHKNTRNATTLGEDMERLNACLTRVSDGLVEPKDKASNLAYFYELGSSSKLSVKRVNQRPQVIIAADPKDPKAAKPELSSFLPLSFDIGVEGSFPDLVRFLDKLRHDRFLARLDQFSIKQGDILAGRVESADVVITVISPLPEKEK